MTNETNAFAGRNIKTLFWNSIDDHAEIIDDIKKALGIDEKAKFVRADRIENEKGKADVAILFSGNRAVYANIKSYAAGFNQATRMSLHKFINVFALGNEVADMLHDRILAKAKDIATPFISEEVQRKP